MKKKIGHFSLEKMKTASRIMIICINFGILVRKILDGLR